MKLAINGSEEATTPTAPVYTHWEKRMLQESVRQSDCLASIKSCCKFFVMMFVLSVIIGILSVIIGIIVSASH